MANTASSAKSSRQSNKRRVQNRSTKSRLHTLEANFLDLVKAGKKDEAAASLKIVFSAFDKAAKSHIIHRNVASRKKSRLAVRLAEKKK